MNQDTICAIATAQGGAIGNIRVSGPHAIDITERIFIPVKAEKKLTGRKPYTLTFGQTTTVFDKQLQYLLEDIAGTMAGNFSTVFSCIRMGSTKQTDKHFIYYFFSVVDMAECEGIWLSAG